MVRAACSLVHPGLVIALLGAVQPAFAQASDVSPAPLGPAPAPPPGTSPTTTPAPPGASPEPAAAPAPAPAPTPALPPSGTKPAASGFQFAFRTGLTFPYGDATGAVGDELGTRYAWQIPLVIDLGARFAQNFFAGAYFGIGFGSTGSHPRLEAACTDDDDDGKNDITCNVVSLRAGLEGSYSFQPSDSFNPWIGYGIGYEATTATYTDHERGYKETVTSGGMTWAQLSLGFDLRKSIGVGPFLEVAIGEFNKTTTEIETDKYRLSIPDRALHAWIMLGLRFVVNP